MRRALACGLALVAGLVAGCGSGGGSKLLGPSDASQLKDTLEQVRKAVDDRNVGACSARVSELRSQVGNLPGTVDRALRVRLREEIVGKLAPKVADQCDDPKTETQDTVTTPAPTGPTGPTDEDPDPTTSTQDTAPPTDTTGTIPTPEPTPSVPTTPSVPDPTQDPGGFDTDPDDGG